MDTPPEENPKKEIVVGLLKWAQACVQLDARVAGVELPDFLRGDKAVMLQLGYDMPVPIPDLTVDDAGIRATLSFRRAPFHCVVPWKAIYIITDGAERRAVFPEDIPPDLLAGPPPADSPMTPPPEPQRSGKKPRPSHLKLV